MDTPEFLVWAIEHTCPIRAQQDGSDPERTERQLRAARAVSDARREGRVFEGLCVEPPDGFRAVDALQVYGGQQAVEDACRGCPANAFPGDGPRVLAGCYGMLPLPVDSARLHEWHAAIDRVMKMDSNDRRWPKTHPGWYGLWLNSPLVEEMLVATFNLLKEARIGDASCWGAIDKFLGALIAAYITRQRIHARQFPQGRVEGKQWRLVSHCRRCKAAWGDHTSGQCQVCGYVGHPADEKKRHARGKRPYYPLDRLLGQQQAADFLVRYAAFRAGQQSSGPAESQPPPERRDSPPAG